MSKKIKMTEEEYFKALSSLLMDYNIFLQESKQIQADINNILEFQKWVLEKTKNLNNVEKSI